MHTRSRPARTRPAFLATFAAIGASLSVAAAVSGCAENTP
jgi:hypothetical protein